MPDLVATRGGMAKTWCSGRHSYAAVELLGLPTGFTSALSIPKHGVGVRTQQRRIPFRPRVTAPLGQNAGIIGMVERLLRPTSRGVAGIDLGNMWAINELRCL